jgi:Zn-finger nucleic acid-binding protein
MPHDGLCELKHAAQRYVTIKCCVGCCILFLDREKHNKIIRMKKKSMCSEKIIIIIIIQLAGFYVS